MQEFFELGQIVNTFGIKGFVKIVPYTEDISRFEQLDKVFLVIIQRNMKLKMLSIIKTLY